MPFARVGFVPLLAYAATTNSDCALCTGRVAAHAVVSAASHFRWQADCGEMQYRRPHNPPRREAVLTIRINGRAHETDADPGTPLLWVLRDYLHLTGTKYGCGIAQCGACTVHVDGRAVRSCVPATGPDGLVRSS